MSKPGRPELVAKIVRLAKLPPCDKTGGYLSRGQLLELAMYLQAQEDELQRLREQSHGTAQTES